MLLLFTIITGVIYPLVCYGHCAGCFSTSSNGSLIMTKDGKALARELIGQQFDGPKYFWGRLSATGNFAYNAFNNAETLTGSSGSNYGALESCFEKNGSGPCEMSLKRLTLITRFRFPLTW